MTINCMKHWELPYPCLPASHQLRVAPQTRGRRRKGGTVLIAHNTAESSVLSTNPLPDRNRLRSTREVDRVLGALVRKCREDRGLTQSRLAEVLGISFQQLQKYESGANRLPVARLIRLCLFMGVPPDRLIADVLREAGLEAEMDPRRGTSGT